MPLVVPGLTSNKDDKTSKWMNDLVGKKIGESSDETVRSVASFGFTVLTINVCADVRAVQVAGAASCCEGGGYDDAGP